MIFDISFWRLKSPLTLKPTFNDVIVDVVDQTIIEISMNILKSDEDYFSSANISSNHEQKQNHFIVIAFPLTDKVVTGKALRNNFYFGKALSSRVTSTTRESRV